VKLAEAKEIIEKCIQDVTKQV